MSTVHPTTEAEAQPVTKDKLMEDLKAVVVDVEELLKATANQTGDSLRFTLPPDTPQGNYSLVLRDADGIETVSANALEVSMHFSRPKITQE